MVLGEWKLVGFVTHDLLRNLAPSSGLSPPAHAPPRKAMESPAPCIATPSNFGRYISRSKPAIQRLHHFQAPPVQPIAARNCYAIGPV